MERGKQEQREEIGTKGTGGESCIICGNRTGKPTESVRQGGCYRLCAGEGTRADTARLCHDCPIFGAPPRPSLQGPFGPLPLVRVCGAAVRPSWRGNDRHALAWGCGGEGGTGCRGGDGGHRGPSRRGPCGDRPGPCPSLGPPARPPRREEARPLRGSRRRRELRGGGGGGNGPATCGCVIGHHCRRVPAGGGRTSRVAGGRSGGVVVRRRARVVCPSHPVARTAMKKNPKETQSSFQFTIVWKHISQNFLVWC